MNLRLHQQAYRLRSMLCAGPGQVVGELAYNRQRGREGGRAERTVYMNRGKENVLDAFVCDEYKCGYCIRKRSSLGCSPV